MEQFGNNIISIRNRASKKMVMLVEGMLELDEEYRMTTNSILHYCVNWNQQSQNQNHRPRLPSPPRQLTFGKPHSPIIQNMNGQYPRGPTLPPPVPRPSFQSGGYFRVPSREGFMLPPSYYQYRQ